MRFDLGDEQVMVRDSVSRAFRGAFETLRNSKQDKLEALFAAIGDTLAVLQLNTALAPVAAGGSGFGYVEAFAIAMESGRYCVPAPVKETLLASLALSRLGSARLLREHAWFTIRLSETPTVTAVASGRHLRVTGCLTGVPFHRASARVVCNVKYVQASGREVTAIAVLDSRGSGVETDEQVSVDVTSGMHAVRFAGYEAAPDEILCDDPQAAIAAIEELRIAGAMLSAAEAAGLSRACLDMTLKYLGTRQTFGRLLGTSQVLRHRAADDFVATEALRVAAQYAAWLMEARDADAPVAISAAKILANTRGLAVAENAMQSHGAIGFTWEYPLHFFLRRLLRLRNEFGTTFEHRARLFRQLVQ